MGSEIEKEDNGELPRTWMGLYPDNFLCPVLVPFLVCACAQLLRESVSCSGVSDFAAP